VQAAVENQLE
jgi:hypothetical protein